MYGSRLVANMSVTPLLVSVAPVNGVHLMFGIFDLFAERECDVVEGAVGKHLLADKLLLEFLFHDTRTETGCFTLVSEIGTINGFEILLSAK